VTTFYRTPNSRFLSLPIKTMVGQDLVLDPCAGYHDLSQHFSNVLTADLFDYPRVKQDFLLDATLESSWKFLAASTSFDWVVIHPPFAIAPKVVPLAFKYAKKGIAFLLRLSYLEPCSDRAEWLKKHKGNLSDLIVFLESTVEMNFVTLAWFVWQREYEGKTNIRFWD
jgi:hypothetical protein